MRYEFQSAHLYSPDQIRTLAREATMKKKREVHLRDPIETPATKPNYQTLWRQQRLQDLRKRTDQIRATRPCADCHQFYQPVQTAFHHRDPSTKIASISALVNQCKPWDVIESEIAKCDLLCHNCHALRHPHGPFSLSR